MQAFRNGNSQVGLAHPKSMGHGIDGLQYVCNRLVRFGRNNNLGEELQMLERIGPMRQLQAGLERPVWVHDIITADTVDDGIIEVNGVKRTVQDALLLAMKRRSNGSN